MDEQSRQDFNAHAPARVAAALWGQQYADSHLGLMGFWDALDKTKKTIARKIAKDVKDARDEREDEI